MVAGEAEGGHRGKRATKKRIKNMQNISAHEKNEKRKKVEPKNAPRGGCGARRGGKKRQRRRRCRALPTKILLRKDLLIQKKNDRCSEQIDRSSLQRKSQIQAQNNHWLKLASIVSTESKTVAKKSRINLEKGRVQGQLRYHMASEGETVMDYSLTRVEEKTVSGVG